MSLDAGEDLHEDANAKAAVGMRTVNNAPTFALLTKSAGTNAWVDVSANGFGAPQANVEYTIVFYLDCTSRTYKASVVVDGKPRTLFAADGRKRFAFAGTATPVAGKVEFSDCKGATKLTGEYSDKRIKDGVIIVVH